MCCIRLDECSVKANLALVSSNRYALENVMDEINRLKEENKKLRKTARLIHQRGQAQSGYLDSSRAGPVHKKTGAKKQPKPAV